MIRSLLAAPAAIVAIIFGWQPTVNLLHNPAAFLWLLAVGAVLAIGALSIAAEHFRNERDEARETTRRLDEQLDATRARLSDALDDLAATPAPLVPFDSLSKAERDFIRPDLHIIPPQRDGEYEWPDIVRAVEGETGGAS